LRLPPSRRLLLVVLAFHLGAIALVSLRELTWLVANDLTIAPKSWRFPAQKIEEFSLAALGENLDPSNCYHQAVASWLSYSGIQGGYGFFAPNISDSYRLVFEFRFPDGHIEPDLPHVSSEESAVRLAGLLDEIARTRIDPLREALIKLLAEDSWRDHPAAVALRATFSSMDVPAPEAFDTDESSHILYVYEFTVAPKR
jgi:hypothetical protein